MDEREYPGPWRVDVMKCGSKEFEEFVFGTTNPAHGSIEWNLAQVFPFYFLIEKGRATSQEHAQSLCDMAFERYYSGYCVPPKNSNEEAMRDDVARENKEKE